MQGALSSLDVIVKLPHHPRQAFWGCVCSVLFGQADQVLSEASLSRLLEAMQVHRYTPDHSFPQMLEEQVCPVCLVCALPWSTSHQKSQMTSLVEGDFSCVAQLLHPDPAQLSNFGLRYIMLVRPQDHCMQLHAWPHSRPRNCACR